MKPRIVVLGTGGTIARYRAAHVSARSLVGRRADIQIIARDLMRISSTDMSEADMMTIAGAVREAFGDRDVQGVVVTCGTDAMEELAWLVALTQPSGRPVAVTGAMYPIDAEESDGPDNLAAAVRVVATRTAGQYGTLVVMHDRIYDPRYAAKWRTMGSDAFEGREGTLGFIGRTRVVFSSPPRPLPCLRPGRLGNVPIISLYIGMPPEEIVRATSGVDGFVLVGFGPGRIPRSVWGAVRTQASVMPAAVVPGVADIAAHGDSHWSGRAEIEGLGVIPLAMSARKARLLVALISGSSRGTEARNRLRAVSGRLAQEVMGGSSRHGRLRKRANSR